MSGQRVLITGAATGIGALAAVSLARAGHTVFASMRDPDGRNAAAARELRDRTADAASPVRIIELDVLYQESANRAATTMVELVGGIDVVVHNAAHLLFGITEAFSAEEVLRAYDVNTVGALRVNRAVLPHMRAAGSGLLLWNGSGVTRAIPPFLGPYSAAKAAFDAFAESVAWEVAVYGIETTILMPGVFTQGTAHFAKAAVPADRARTAEYDRVAPYLASSAEDTERLMVDGVSADPQIVADEIVRLVGLPRGSRPRRAVADGSDYGAEIVNGAAEELRLRLARRMGITELARLAVD
ncbi:NAD(P)-dependent dehydrogenase (short-subunit alcohol dehydrogenase family) [Crossiella equi]|uniref:NAD(P)-dependent dehydrogenase (Short-subunit alcohol dehydrogenase family) n=1 Tax=Crossiella equi TaxID=130796 RepID=A0ABS5A7S9_9PSEU|nr:SDR family NAD(P)-dependent oxidoreductase [Crossiella equi]MBP2472284.1 NAD(P)-dependent dehydrogenase (short-subunit alcohol dehydrogenase family) [Crossiella equi]